MRAAGARRVGRALVPAVPVPGRPAFPPRRRRSGLRSRTVPVVLAVGRLAPQKGFGILLEAAARWRDIRPEPLLVIVGEGPLEAELKAEAAALRPRRAVPRPARRRARAAGRRRRFRAAQPVGRPAAHPAGGAARRACRSWPPASAARRSSPARTPPCWSRRATRTAGRRGPRGAHRSCAGRPAAPGRRWTGPARCRASRRRRRGPRRIRAGRKETRRPEAEVAGAPVRYSIAGRRARRGCAPATLAAGGVAGPGGFHAGRGHAWRQCRSALSCSWTPVSGPAPLLVPLPSLSSIGPGGRSGALGCTTPARCPRSGAARAGCRLSEPHPYLHAHEFRIPSL